MARRGSEPTSSDHGGAAGTGLADADADERRRAARAGSPSSESTVRPARAVFTRPSHFRQ